MKLEEIAPYLPYGLKALDEHGKIKIINWRMQTYTLTEVGLNHVITDCLNHFDDSGKYQLILHPLSDLTKSCLPDGKIPIVELAKIVMESIWGYSTIEAENKIELLNDESNFGLIYIDSTNERIGFSFETELNKLQFFFSVNGNQLRVNQLQLFQKLFAWHFDVFGLLEIGEAININTLNL